MVNGRRGRELRSAFKQHGGFPKLGVTFLGVPIIRTYGFRVKVLGFSILGSILGSPHFGKLPHLNPKLHGLLQARSAAKGDRQQYQRQDLWQEFAVPRKTFFQTPNSQTLMMGVPQNWGYLVGGPYNNDYMYNVSGSGLKSLLGSPYLGKLPYRNRSPRSPCPQGAVGQECQRQVPSPQTKERAENQ